MSTKNAPVPLLTVDDVATMLGKHRITIYDMVARKEIPHIRVSPRTIRFDRGDIERWLESRKESAA